MAAIHCEQQALLYLSEARGVRCERSQHGLRPRTPAERVERTATSEEHDGKQKSKQRFLDLIAGHRQEQTFRLSADFWMLRMCCSNVLTSSSMACDKCLSPSNISMVTSSAVLIPAFSK